MKAAKKIMSSLLALAMAASAGVGALADGTEIKSTEAGQNAASVPVTVTAEQAATFSVKVPSSLPLTINADGTVTVPTNLQIENDSAGPVKVTSIQATKGDWSLAAYGTNFDAVAVGSNKLGFKLNDATTVDSENSTQTLANFDASKWTIGGGKKLPITVDADASAVSAAVENASAASVIFTVAWDAAEGTTPATSDPEPTATTDPTPTPTDDPAPEPSATTDPEPEPQTIHFTIDGVEYEAKPGMTWFAWAKSSMNTASYESYYYTDDNYKFKGYFIGGENEKTAIYEGNCDYVTPSSEIHGGTVYHLKAISFENDFRKDEDAFYNKSGTTLRWFYGAAKTYAIPSGVTSIGESAFEECDSLTRVTIPSSVTSIGSSAFSWCTALTSVTIPEGVTTIGDYAFATCLSLESVTIPSSVTSIGDWAFQGTALTSVTIPEGITSIGELAFSDCGLLKSVTIPEGVTTIGESAFEHCTSLTSVTIPEGVTSIGQCAFGDCSSLTSVTIPSSVTSIGDWAFYDCTALTSVTIQAATPPTMERANIFMNCLSGLKIYVPSGSVDAYKAAEGWSAYASSIEAIQS